MTGAASFLFFSYKFEFVSQNFSQIVFNRIEDFWKNLSSLRRKFVVNFLPWVVKRIWNCAVRFVIFLLVLKTVPSWIIQLFWNWSGGLNFTWTLFFDERRNVNKLINISENLNFVHNFPWFSTQVTFVDYENLVAWKVLFNVLK